MKKLDRNYEDIKDDFGFLGRRDFYNSIIESLKNYEVNYTIALNGIWGSGKTILVKKCWKILIQMRVNCLVCIIMLGKMTISKHHYYPL